MSCIEGIEGIKDICCNTEFQDAFDILFIMIFLLYFLFQNKNKRRRHLKKKKKNMSKNPPNQMLSIPDVFTLFAPKSAN